MAHYHIFYAAIASMTCFNSASPRISKPFSFVT
jgi:hypothetical protein